MIGSAETSFVAFLSVKSSCLSFFWCSPNVKRKEDRVLGKKLDANPPHRVKSPKSKSSSRSRSLNIRLPLHHPDAVAPPGRLCSPSLRGLPVESLHLNLSPLNRNLSP